MKVTAGAFAGRTVKDVVAGSWPGLFGGAGLVTASVHAPGDVRYAALIVACRTLALSSVEFSVIGGFPPCWSVTTEVLKKFVPYTVMTGLTVGPAMTLAGK